MKTSNLILATFTLGLLFSTSIFASNPTNTPEYKPWRTQIITNLDGLDLRQAEASIDKLFLDFIINEMGELIVISTSDRGLDSTIKRKLNYIKVNAGDLSLNTKYTLPVNIKN